jgi:N-acyl-D-aspartate/D-glutamate deacylase
MLDYVIKDGTLVDGTGAPGRPADVGVRDGRVVAVGQVSEPARETVDASDLVVTPGFVDPHTHYDAQLFWDPLATPSNLHGVTSVIAGNCGFTLAPIDPTDADYTRRMMAKVEGMPLAALEEGLDWEWRSFADYLDRLEGSTALNAGFLVGHCALRRIVMGPDAVGNPASAEQQDRIVEALHTALAAGGLGFSTSLSFTHSDADNQPVPSRWSTHDEVLALCDAVRQHPGTTVEMIIDGCLRGFSPTEIELMSTMSARADRPVNWNVLTVDSSDPDRYLAQIALGDEAARRGGRVVALTMPILVSMNMSFLTNCALFLMPAWDTVTGLPVPERMAKLRDPEVRRMLDEKARSPEAGVFTRLADWANYRIGDTYSAANEGLKGRTVGEIAAERGTSAFDTLVDIVLEDDLRTVLWPLPPDDDAESWRMRAEAWHHPYVMIGGSDAGAHLDRMSGAQYTTAFLGDCLRGKRLTTLEDAVRLMTSVPAALFGLRDRGKVEVGAHADLVVLDPATVDAGESTMVNDLPGRAARLYTPAIGVHRVFVNGRPIVVDGEPTGETPGRLLRSGRDTDTVSVSA